MVYKTTELDWRKQKGREGCRYCRPSFLDWGQKSNVENNRAEIMLLFVDNYVCVCVWI